MIMKSYLPSSWRWRPPSFLFSGSATFALNVAEPIIQGTYGEPPRRRYGAWSTSDISVDLRGRGDPSTYSVSERAGPCDIIRR